jgi:hypothetical protein
MTSWAMHEQRAPAHAALPAQVGSAPGAALQQAAPRAPHEQTPVATVLLSQLKPGWHDAPSQHASFAPPHWHLPFGAHVRFAPQLCSQHTCPDPPQISQPPSTQA